MSRYLLKSMHLALEWFLEKVYRDGRCSTSTRILQNRFVTDKNGQNQRITIEKSETKLKYHYDSNSKSIKRANDEFEFFENLPKIMQILGIYVAFDDKTFIKLLKAVSFGIKINSSFKKFAH